MSYLTTLSCYPNCYLDQQPFAVNYSDAIFHNQLLLPPIDNYVFFCFAGLKKDLENSRLEYKDKFLSHTVFQWESKNNTTKENIEGQKLQRTKRVYLFVRKMKTEDGVTLPFTFFGTGILTNMRSSYTEDGNGKYPTLLFDIVLDNEVPKSYSLDFEIPDDDEDD